MAEHIEVMWGDPAKEAIVAIYQPGFSAEEAIQASKQAYQMTETVPHTVHIIMDFSQIKSSPPGILTRLPELAQLIHPRAGRYVLVGGRGLVSLLAELFSKVYRQIETAPTVDEAYAGLHRHADERQVS